MNDKRPQRRAVMHVSMPILQELLGLPDDVEVLHIGPGHHGLSLAVVLTHPDIPEIPPECTPWTISPTLERTADGSARILSTGIETLKSEHTARPGHRRSCQHDAVVPGTDCPGCAEIDAAFAAAHADAAAVNPPRPQRG